MVELGISTAHSTRDYGLSKRLSIVEKLIDLRGKTILDLGCGNGLYAMALARSAERVVGIDIRPSTIRSAQELLSENREAENLDLCLMSGTHLGFTPESIDVVVMIEVLEHVAKPLKVLRNVNNVLKEEGRLVLSVPNKLFPFETHSIKIGEAKIEPPIPFTTLLPSRIRRNFETARLYTLGELAQILHMSGFAVANHESLFPYFGDGESSGLRSALRKVSDKRENTPFLRNLGMSLFLSAKKLRGSED